MDKHQQSNNVDNQTPRSDKPGLDGLTNHDTVTGRSLLDQRAVDGATAVALVGLQTAAVLVGPSNRKGRGNKASPKYTSSLEHARRAMMDFLQEGDLPLKYNPGKEFGVFNRVVLQPRTTVEVDSLQGRSFAGFGQLGKSGVLVSYKAHLDDVVRPDGSYGRVLNEFKSVMIYKVPAETTPLALKALPEVLLPISAVVCDEFEGLEIWVNHDWDLWHSRADFQFGIIQAMRSAGIEGIVAEPQSYWMIPGSLPERSSHAKPVRRRLLFACSEPHSFGMNASKNELSDIWP